MEELQKETLWSKGVSALNKRLVALKLKKDRLVQDCRGEGYVDSGVKILIAVVIGALLLAGLYALFNETIMPTIKQKIIDLFDYSGE